MMKELISGHTWNRTSQPILEKFGKRIDFRFISVAEEKSSFYSKGDDLIIPLKQKKDYLGDVIVNRGANLTTEQKFEITDLVQFLIEPQVYNLHLKQFESSLKQSAQTSVKSTAASESNSNLISLFKATTPDTFKESDPSVISNILHIKSVDMVLRRKVALKIHDIANHQFFLNFQDISSQISTASELKSFGRASFYIENIKTLNFFEIQILNDFCLNFSTNDIVFLIGSDLSDTEINDLACANELKNDLLAFLYDVDRVPLAQQTSREVLELLFFNNAN